jgi:hypothetical protein
VQPAQHVVRFAERLTGLLPAVAQGVDVVEAHPAAVPEPFVLRCRACGSGRHPRAVVHCQVRLGRAPRRSVRPAAGLRGRTASGSSRDGVNGLSPRPGNLEGDRGGRRAAPRR